MLGRGHARQRGEIGPLAVEAAGELHPQPVVQHHRLAQVGHGGKAHQGALGGGAVAGDDLVLHLRRQPVAVEGGQGRHLLLDLGGAAHPVGQVEAQPEQGGEGEQGDRQAVA